MTRKGVNEAKPRRSNSGFQIIPLKLYLSLVHPMLCQLTVQAEDEQKIFEANLEPSIISTSSEQDGRGNEQPSPRIETSLEIGS